MSTFGQMQSDIADELNKTNLTAQIKRGIVASMKKHRNQRFKFNYASSTLTTSDGQAVYPLPEGYMGDELVEVLDGVLRDDLTKRDYAWIVQRDTVDTHKSSPRVYAIIDGDNARLYPRPDLRAAYSASGTLTSSNYILLWHYHKDLNADGVTGAISICASDSVTNAWMTDGFDLIRLEAKIWVYTNIIRGPEAKQEAASLVPERNAMLRSLVKEYQKTVGSGSINPYFGAR